MNSFNVLLLTVDSLRVDRLGYFGRRPSITPNIDRLAESGIKFTQAITNGSWTQAAFPAMLTSTYPSMHGGCLGYLSPQRPSPIETLAKIGYATGGFSTIPHLSKATGYNRGFGHFVDLEPGDSNPAIRSIKGGQRLLKSSVFHALAGLFGLRMRPAKVYCSAKDVVGALRNWLEEAKAPFFGWAHFMDVHWPYHLETSLMEPTEIAQAWQDLSNMHERADRSKPSTLSNRQRERFVQLYETALAYLDSQIGHLVDYLDSSGILETTILVLTSDHGEEFTEHGRWGHTERNMYDEVLSIPLILRIPGWQERQAIARQVRLLDLMPTLLDLCDCRPPGGMDGTSLVPLWSGKGKYEVEFAISERPRHPWYQIAVRTEAYKYIWEEGKPEQPELYDLRADPGETRNISAAEPEVRQRFQAIVDLHLGRVAKFDYEMSALPVHHDEKVLARLRDLGYVD